MKKTLTLLIVLGLWACSKNGAIVTTNIGRDISISAGESVPLQDPRLSSPFPIKVLEINDYRCPAGAFCFDIWMGYTSAKFEIESNSFWLKIGESKEFTAAGNNYRITLKDVVPFPSLQNPNEKKKALFVVVPL